MIHVVIAIIAGDNAVVGDLTDQSTILTEHKHLAEEGGAVPQGQRAGGEEAVSVEVIDLAVDLGQSHVAGITGVVVAGTVVVTGAASHGVPCTGGHTGLVKLVGNAGNGVLAGDSDLGPGLEVVPVLADLLPAAGQLADLGVTISIDRSVKQQAGVLDLTGANAVVAKVIVVAIHGLDAGELHAVSIVAVLVPADDSHAVSVGLAISVLTIEQLAAAALQNAVHDLIAVAGSRNGGAPFNDRVTDIAEGAAGVAVLSTGRCLIGNGFSGVDVPALLVGIIAIGIQLGVVAVDLRDHFNGSHGEGAAGAIGVADSAAVHAQLNVHRPNNLSGPQLFGGLILVLLVLSQAGFPSANGKLCQRCSAGSCHITSAGNNHNCIVCLIVILIGGSEALSNDHVIQLPLADGVQIQSHGNGLDLLNIGGVQVHPVDRTDQQLGCIGGSRNQRHTCHVGICFHSDIAGAGGLVAHIVADLKGNSVDTVSQHCISNGDHTVLHGAGNFHAIDVCLCGCFIQPGVVVLLGIFLHAYAEADNITGHGLSVEHSTFSHTHLSILDAVKNGGFSVINRGGIVDGNVVEIEGKAAVYGSIVLKIHSGCRLVAVRAVNLHGIDGQHSGNL